jgi:peptide-methionine (S)-S-oxide reductase
MRSTLLGLCVSMALFSRAAYGDEAPRLVPPPQLDNPLATGNPQTAVLAGGCYWGMQGLFERVKGVRQVTAGFSGHPKPTNEDDIIGRGQLGPAEAIQIVFDPAQISYGQILQIYFSVAHDPTELNRQRSDVGPQYRSDIFYSDDTQQKIAQAYVAQLENAKVFGAPIVTRVDEFTVFHRAGDSQQDYTLKNSTLAYVVTFDLPREAALKKLFPDRYLDTPLTFSDHS